MGRPKALLPWRGATLVEYQLDQFAASRGTHITLVLGHGAREISERVAGRRDVRVVENPDYLQGRASSVVTGVRATPPDAKAFLILNVDQPRPAWLIDRVVDAHLSGDAAITIPTHDGRGGHPSLFNANLREEMLAITEERLGLKEVVRRDPGRVARVEVSSSLVLLDVNTPKSTRGPWRRSARPGVPALLDKPQARAYVNRALTPQFTQEEVGR